MRIHYLAEMYFTSDACASVQPGDNGEVGDNVLLRLKVKNIYVEKV